MKYSLPLLAVFAVCLASCQSARVSRKTTPEEHALAFGAYAALARDEPPGQLNQPPSPAASAEDYRKRLEDVWQIHNKQELLIWFGFLGQVGRRQYYAKIQNALREVPPASLNTAIIRGYVPPSHPALELWAPIDTKDMERRLLVLKHLHDETRREPPIAAWDLGRYIDLCVQSYRAGYLTEREALARIMSMARRIQRSFGSWEDYSRDYLLGWRFESPESVREEDEKYQKITRDLLDPRQGYWSKMDWSGSLGDGPVDTIPAWEDPDSTKPL